MIIQRDFYLNKLIAGLNNRMIKIITGLRRSGKSFLLFELFHRYLTDRGVDRSHLIEVALDDRRNKELRDPDMMLDYISSRITDDSTYYILLDEVQMIDEFVDLLNSLLHIKNAQVYVTGSNSRFLSKDVATEFRGRGYEIHVYPLSFAEYYSAFGGDVRHCWKEYYRFGGLPQLINYTDDQAKKEFLKSLIESVYLKDILERHRIKNRAEFEELLQVVASTIGSPFNPTRLEATFKSVKQKTIDRKTINKYLEYASDAFLIDRAMLYNIRGKKYINTLSKYYFEDVGLRNALLNFRQNEPGHLMENVIYNELRRRGLHVDIGQIDEKTTNRNGETVRKIFEVDFVANIADKRYYIQSAERIDDYAKLRQESASLLKIKDFFIRIIIINDDIKPYWNEDGIFIIGLFDFLLDINSLANISQQ